MRQSIESGFFNTAYDSETGKFDREYSSAQFRELFALFFTDGIFVDYGEEFAIKANGTMQVQVSKGFGFVRGAWAKNENAFMVQIKSNITSETRVDGIFLQSSTIDRDCAIVYRENDTECVRNEAVYELLLATITVPSNASRLTQTNITDMRPTDQCGFVGGAVQQMSVANLYAQFTQEFTEWKQNEEQKFLTWRTEEQDKFDSWYQNIRDQLSEDAAGNLQLQVNDVVESVDNLQTEVYGKFVVTDEEPSTLESGKFYFVY